VSSRTSPFGGAGDMNRSTPCALVGIDAIGVSRTSVVGEPHIGWSSWAWLLESSAA
jgi:hypothetical protein